MFKSGDLKNNKFWHIKRAGTKTFASWGKLGCKTSHIDKEFASVAAAKAHLTSMVQSKRKSGYIPYSDNKLTAKTRDLLKKMSKVSEGPQSIKFLDVVFCLDITGSMGSYIAAVKGQIHEVANDIARVFPDVEVRYAFAGYRDYCDAAGGNRFSVLPFTTDLARFRTFVAGVRATSGAAFGSPYFAKENQ